MAARKATSTAQSGQSDLDQDMDESLWSSPVKSMQGGRGPSKNGSHIQAEQQPATELAREQMLRAELSNVRKVNETIEGVLHNLDRAKTNMGTVNQTVGAASSLLNTWTRILAQTEHNQRLILDPSWQGASQDMADVEAETVAKQQATLRREVEEQERREAAAKKAEEEQTRRELGTTSQPRTSLRERGRGSGRATAGAAKQTGYLGADSKTSSIGRGSNNPRRTTSGIGRGRAGRARG